MNKSILFLFTILLFGANFIQAQNKDTKKIGGIRGGFHSATMLSDGSKPDTVNNLKRFYVGIFRDNKIAPILHFGTGLEYFQNGMKYSRNVERILHTLSVPLYLKVKLGPVFALGGAAPNFKLKEKVDYQDNTYNPGDTDKTKDLTWQLLQGPVSRYYSSPWKPGITADFWKRGMTCITGISN